MKNIISKKSFKKIWYNPNTFLPYYTIFNKNKTYNIDNEKENSIEINNYIFYKNSFENLDNDYVYDYFYTEKENRKLKLEKLYEKM